MLFKILEEGYYCLFVEASRWLFKAAPPHALNQAKPHWSDWEIFDGDWNAETAHLTSQFQIKMWELLNRCID